MLIEPEQYAAFHTSYFVHSFIKEYKAKKDNPSFLGDQRLQLALYDAKKGRAFQQAPPAAPKKKPPPPKFVSPPPIAKPGPGPKAMASYEGSRHDYFPQSSHAADIGPQTREILPPHPRPNKMSPRPDSRGIGPRPKQNSPPRRPSPAPLTRSFRDIEESSDDEKENSYIVHKKSTSKRRHISPAGPTIKVKRPPAAVDKPKRKTMPSDYESSGESSDGEEYDSKPRTTANKSKDVKSRKSGIRKEEKPLGRTGDLYDPPCSSCRLAQRTCEKTGMGSACFACRRSKQRCEYAQPKRRRPRSNEVIDSADEESDDNDDGHVPRQAAKVAKKAITKAIEVIELPESSKKKRATGKSKGMLLQFPYIY